MKKNTIIGLAIGTSIGCAVSIVFQTILAIPIGTSLGISIGMIFSGQKREQSISIRKYQEIL